MLLTTSWLGATIGLMVVFGVAVTAVMAIGTFVAWRGVRGLEDGWDGRNEHRPVG